MLLAGCGSDPKHAPSLGEAFIGPSTLNLRSDIPTQSSSVATVKHGDRVEILQQRRSFLRVRAPNGAEGWTELRQLLAADEIQALKVLANRTAMMPSQGRATTDADLRVHIQPATRSPSVLTLLENEKVDVLTHITRPRTDLPRKPLLPPPVKKAKAPKKPAKPPKYPPPPMPVPPGPPANWLELSRRDLPDDAAEEAPPSVAPAIPTDDWSLVRTTNGQAGWVLTRRLRMDIPDEVAQYAEGHRIVSYFSLGYVRDGEEKKDIWLWTTLGSAAAEQDFDSFRVFAWSLRRHRYETQYIERNLKGYGPVLLQPVPYSPGGVKSTAAAEPYPGFSLCVEKKDGLRYRRQYAVLNATIRFAGEQVCEAVEPVEFGVQPAAPAYGCSTARAASQEFHGKGEETCEELVRKVGKSGGKALTLRREHPLCYLWVQVGHFDPTRAALLE